MRAIECFPIERARALVPLVGLLLNYTPWGIRLTPVTMSLLSLTIILTITGLIREYQEKHLLS